jgi:hypothetical protein
MPRSSVRFVRRSAFVLGCALLPAASAEADVVTTRDGLVLEGRAVRDGAGWKVETTEGAVVLPSSAVVKVEPGAGPRAGLSERAAKLAADDAAGWYRLALEAEAAGVPDVARSAYERIVAVQPDHPAARRALRHERVGDAWMPEEEARRW